LEDPKQLKKEEDKRNIKRSFCTAAERIKTQPRRE